MTDHPDVSVVIPARDAMTTLPRQLDALTRQKYDEPSFEVIVADNGHNTGLDALVTTYRAAGLDVTVADARDRRGTAHARNVGFDHARADHVMFCDADDVVSPWWVRAGHETLNHVPAFSGGAIECHDARELTTMFDGTQERRIRDYYKTDRNVYPEGTYPILLGQSFGVRREVFIEVGGFSSHLTSQAEDNDLAFKLQRHLHELVQFPEVLVAYDVGRPKNLRTTFKAGRDNARVVMDHDAIDLAPSFAGHWILRPIKDSVRRRDPRPAVRMLGGAVARLERR